MKIKFLLTFVFLIPMGMLSSCSDFRKAVGQEKVIPDEFSVAVTPSLLIPPGYEIDPQVFKNNDLEKTNDNFNLNEEIDIKDKKEASSFSELFDTKNVPKDIRKLVDEETLGISLGERTGIDILFGNIPKTGVVLDPKKEALRIKNNNFNVGKITLLKN